MRWSCRRNVLLLLLFVTLFTALSWIREHSAASATSGMNRFSQGGGYLQKHGLEVGIMMEKSSAVHYINQSSILQPSTPLPITTGALTHQHLASSHTTSPSPVPSSHSQTTPSPLPPVLDTKGVKIVPKQATVPEGHSLQVTCLSMQLMHMRGENAPHVTFELPLMSTALERKVLVTISPGLQ